MRITHIPGRAAAMLAIGALLIASVTGAACEDTDPEADPTPVQTFKITPASGGRPSPTAVVSPTAPAEVSPTAAAGGTELTVTGLNSIFEQEELDAPAGVITVTFDNRDPGIVHNIHFFAGEDADADDAGETELEVGPIVQTLTMTLDLGAYFYQCDAHPTTMSGLLTVR